MQVRETNLLSGYLPPDVLTRREGLGPVVETDLKKILDNASFGLTLSNGLSFSSVESILQTTQDGKIRGTTAVGSRIRPEFTLLQKEISPDTYELTLKITNTTSSSLPLDTLTLLNASSDTPISNQQCTFMQPGWQSWSAATHEATYDHLPTDKHTLSTQKGPQLLSSEFPWMTLIKRDGNHAVLLGFADTQTGIGILHGDQTMNVYATSEIKGKVLMPGENFESDPLLLLSGPNSHELLQKYATSVAEHMHAAPIATLPTGWTSWYEYFDTYPVTKDEITKQITILDKRRIPAEYIQIDDGYQEKWGDWQPRKDIFPDGLKPVVDMIHASGRKAGIWWNPFLVDENSQLVQNHPDWLVKESPDDVPLPARLMTQGPQHQEVFMYALDPTHPAVLEYLAQTTKQFTQEYGFDLLKLDFLYAGMLASKRFNPHLTLIESYRQALQVIKNHAGNAHLLGSGAPFLPSVGLVDSMRISGDTSFEFLGEKNPWHDQPGLHNVLRSIFSHWWMNKWWINDPDALTLRNHTTHLTTDEKRTFLTTILLSGGSRWIGDDLSLLEEEHLALLPQILHFPQVAAIPFGPFENGLPAKTIACLSDTLHFVAVYNWSDLPQDYTFFYPHAEMTDMWTGETITPHKPYAIGAHGVKLVKMSS